MSKQLGSGRLISYYYLYA